MKALSRDREDRYPTIGSMKKSMLTACESCHVAWHEPFSLKGLEHLTAANRKPIEQGGQCGQGEQGGHGDMATQAAMTTAMRSLRTRWWDADRPHSVVTLVAVALVVAMALFIALWSRGPLAHPPPPGPPPGAQHERPPGAQPERSPGAQPEQSTGAQPAPWAQPGGLRPVSGRTADGKGPEAAPAPAPAKPAAPAPAPQAPQAKSGPQAGAKVRREPALLSAGLLLPPGVRQGLAEIGVVALRVGVSVSRHGRATDHKVLNQLRRPLTGEEERAIHEGVRLLEFEPATEDGEPVAGKMSFYVPLV
jgi:pyruvate/2-oxoglutarate dehydrogenase complex dihydrolipoamide acyltransferase (E2) component